MSNTLEVILEMQSSNVNVVVNKHNISFEAADKIKEAF
jgi:hypothetical protein